MGDTLREAESGCRWSRSCLVRCSAESRKEKVARVAIVTDSADAELPDDDLRAKTRISICPQETLRRGHILRRQEKEWGRHLSSEVRTESSQWNVSHKSWKLWSRLVLEDSEMQNTSGNAMRDEVENVGAERVVYVCGLSYTRLRIVRCGLISAQAA